MAPSRAMRDPISWVLCLTLNETRPGGDLENRERPGHPPGARTFTGRKKLVMFEGHYHGWSEAVFNRYHAPLADLPAEGFGRAIPGTTGMSDSLTDVIVVQWNDLDALERCFQQHGSGRCR